MSALVAAVGLVVSYLQLRRTPQVTTPSSSARPRAQLVVGDVLREPLSHTRRAALLNELARALAGDRVVSLIGGRGVGKTHLAATYTRERLARGLTWAVWIVAVDAAAMVTALAELARQAGVVDEVVDTEAAAKAALRWLEQQPEPSLIVLDNAVDPDLVVAWLPRRGKVQVLITTTNQEFTVLGSVVRVGVFTPVPCSSLGAPRRRCGFSRGRWRTGNGSWASTTRHR